MGIEEAAGSGFDDQSSIKPTDRIKFLYSYGGRIMPRPGDWKLRYVGGETRVMAANRNISFADLMAKMAAVLGSSPVLKCQLPSQDPDALVSIRSDEDLHNILEEYNRQGTKQPSSKVRAFLFPSKPPVAPSPMLARTPCGYPNHRGQSLFAHSDGQHNSPARSASKIQHKTTIPRQHNSADRAMTSVYMDYGHCLRSLFINNRPPSPLGCHYTSHSPLPATQNPRQHIRSYMKVA